MANINLTLTPASPTGSLVFTIGTPGPQGLPGPQGPAGPTFIGGPITSPITYTVGTNTTVFENGDIYTENTATGAYGVVYINGLEASDGTHTLAMTASGITFGDSTFQSTAFPGSAAFYPSTGNPSGFLTASALTPYLLSSTAASTYQTLAGMSAYLSKAGNLSGLSSTATARTNLGLGTMATETASNYLTVSAAASGYYPLSGNPSGFLTDAPSDGSQYARQDGAWSVVTGGGGTFNGGTITNPLTVLAAGTSSVEVNTTGIIASDLTSGGSVGGTFDYAGLSLFASTDSFNVYPSYAETQDSSNGYYAVIYPNGVQAGDASVQTIISSAGVTFPDNSVQTTAAVSGFVPGSGDLNLGGYSITDGNFSSPAGQVNAQNVTLTSGDGGAITFADGTTQTTAATGGGNLPDGYAKQSYLSPDPLTGVAFAYTNNIAALNSFNQLAPGGFIDVSTLPFVAYPQVSYFDLIVYSQQYIGIIGAYPNGGNAIYNPTYDTSIVIRIYFSPSGNNYWISNNSVLLTYGQIVYISPGGYTPNIDLGPDDFGLEMYVYTYSASYSDGYTGYYASPYYQPYGTNISNGGSWIVGGTRGYWYSDGSGGQYFA